MAKYTLFVSYGNDISWSSSASVYDSLESAVRALSDAVGRSAMDSFAPLHMITIRPGDHAPRLQGGKWVAPGEKGWTIEHTSCRD